MIHDNTEQISETFARQFLEAYLSAWNSHNPQNVLSLAAKDVIWEDPTIPGGRAEGHYAVQTWLNSFWNAFPDMTFEFLDGISHQSPDVAALSFGKKSLIAPWRCRGSWQGPI